MKNFVVGVTCFLTLILVESLVASDSSVPAQTGWSLLQHPAEARSPVLLPVFINVAGAHGSFFVTELTIVNTGTAPAVVRHLLACATLCPPVEDATVTVPPGGSSSPAIQPTGAPGLLLYVETAELPHLNFSLRVRDLSRNADSAGTEIPVVRLEEWRSTVALPNVPSQSGFRSTLRIYGRESGPVTVRYIRSSDGKEIGTQMVELQAPQSAAYPAYVEIRELPSASEAMHVVVLGHGRAIYALLTLTNNRTQEITTISPQ